MLPAAARSTFSKRRHFREQRKDKGAASGGTRSHPTLTGHIPTQLWRSTFPATSPRRLEKPRNRQRKVWMSKNENVLPAAARSTFLKNTHLNHRRIIKQSMKNQHKIVKESLKNHETIMNKSWTKHEKIMNASLNKSSNNHETNHEKIMKQSATNH